MNSVRRDAESIRSVELCLMYEKSFDNLDLSMRQAQLKANLGNLDSFKQFHAISKAEARDYDLRRIHGHIFSNPLGNKRGVNRSTML
jgi:hypothetical protein